MGGPPRGDSMNTESGLLLRLVRLPARAFDAPFFAAILRVAGGNAFAQAILVAASPLLARLYPPEAFGLFASYVAVVTVAGSLACLKYELAILLPGPPRRALHLLHLCLAGAPLLLAPALVALAAAPRLLPAAPAFPPGHLAILFLGALCIAWTTAAINFHIKTGAFALYAASGVARSTVCVAAQALLAASGAAFGLVAGHLLGMAVQLLLVLRRIPLSLRTLRRGRLNRLALLRHRKMPQFVLPNATLDLLSEHGVVLLVQAFYRSSDVGYYYLAYKLLVLPVTILGTAVSQVFTRDLAEGPRARIFPKTVSLAALLALASLAPFALLAACAPAAFSVALGARWERAGEFVTLLCPWMFFRFITSPLTMIPIVTERQEVPFMFTTLYNIARLALFAALAGSGAPLDETLRVTFHALAGMLAVYAGILILIARKEGRRDA